MPVRQVIERGGVPVRVFTDDNARGGGRPACDR